jgi:hypothetical protein
MNITKIESGFTLNGKDYTFKKFVVLENDAEVEVLTDTVNEKTVHVGTDKGIICITTDITLDSVEYDSIEALVTELTK